MNIKLIEPTKLDMKVINSWVGKNIIEDYEQVDENALIVLTENEDTGHYRIFRFFTLGDKTEVSVDFDSSRREPINENFVFKLITKYFSK